MQKCSLEAKTDVAELAQVLSWFEQIAPLSLPKTTLMQCQMLLAEGFINAVRHAHCDRSPETPITIEVTLLEQTLEMRIWDFGLLFDLRHKLKSLPAKIDPEAPGGRGLKLLQTLADDLSYTRKDDRNCLLMVKHYGCFSTEV